MNPTYSVHYILTQKENRQFICIVPETCWRQKRFVSLKSSSVGSLFTFAARRHTSVLCSIIVAREGLSLERWHEFGELRGWDREVGIE